MNKLTDFQKNVLSMLYIYNEQVRGGILSELSDDLEEYFLKINAEIEEKEQEIKRLKGHKDEEN